MNAPPNSDATFIVEIACKVSCDPEETAAELFATGMETEAPPLEVDLICPTKKGVAETAIKAKNNIRPK
jgi:hypothetical protein